MPAVPVDCLLLLLLLICNRNLWNSEPTRTPPLILAANFEGIVAMVTEGFHPAVQIQCLPGYRIIIRRITCSIIDASTNGSMGVVRVQ
jgi:hypothetical protein